MRCWTLVVALGLIGCLLPACAGPAVKHETAAAIAPRAVAIVRGADGTPVAWEQVIADAARADAVLIGETHGHALGLTSAAAVWDDVLAKDAKAGLALEFFERDEQAALDDYLAGLTDEKTFRERAGRTTGNYPPGHAAMVEAAKAGGRPVIAANAPRVYVRTARKDGYEKLAGLTREQRRLFRIPDEVPTGPYRERFDELMSGMGAHTAPPTGGQKAAGSSKPTSEAPVESAEQVRARLDASFRSQSLWDWTMAESTARALDAGSSPVVLVVGRFHVEFDGGLVQALRKLRPGTRVVTIVYTDEEPESPGEEKTKGSGRADYVIRMAPAEEKQAAAR